MKLSVWPNCSFNKNILQLFFWRNQTTLLKMVGKCWELAFDVFVGRIGAVVHTNTKSCGVRSLGFFPAKQRHQLREMQKRIQYRFFDITYKVKTLGIHSPCQRMIGGITSETQRSFRAPWNHSERKVIGSLGRQGWAKNTPKKMVALFCGLKTELAKMSTSHQLTQNREFF